MANDTTNTGPAIGDQISEVQAIFPSDQALQDAIARLTQTGRFDRADLSLPHAQLAAGEATPEQSADNPDTETDSRQMRTLGASTAAAAVGMAAAGVTIATGGAAGAALAAAAAGGLAAGGATEAAHGLSDRAQHESRQQAAKRGELVLAVRIIRAENQLVAEQAMRDAGATKIAAVTRADAGIQSAAWTG